MRFNPAADTTHRSPPSRNFEAVELPPSSTTVPTVPTVSTVSTVSVPAD